MGSSKRTNHPRHGRPQTQLRSRTTRSSKGRLLTDPAHNTQLLTEQLRSLGLYAAPTLGDGNCLFRALSDQLYGTPSHHLQLRKEICDWIEGHKGRYEPFVEDDRGLDVHLKCMRENATYGGHLELSAFAHLFQRNVKVIQPGLVYVIEWDAGGGGSGGSSSRGSPPPSPKVMEDDPMLDEREKRRLRRDKKRAEKENAILESGGQSSSSSGDTIYVAYHDWEHFSSIRNLRGPHSGLPEVSELPADAIPSPPTPRQSKLKSPSKQLRSKPTSKSKLSTSLITNITPPTPIISATSSSNAFTFNGSPLVPSHPPTPTQIPLPPSRSQSPSPPSSLLSPPPSTSTSTSSPPPSLSATSTIISRHRNLTSLDSNLNPLRTRSPKRSFDESSGSGSSAAASEENVAKRTRSSKAGLTHARASVEAEADDEEVDGEVDDDDDEEEEDISTPGLSAPGSTTSTESSPSPPPPPPLSPPKQKQKLPLTRRQRKALGLPKRGNGAGKIVIPGGRYKLTSGGGSRGDSGEGEGDGDGAEWKRNGNGRVDVRGFRELKI